MVAPAVPRHGDGPYDLEHLHPLLAQPALVEHGGAGGEVGVREERLHHREPPTGIAAYAGRGAHDDR
jgi:hypothetical protein